MKALGEGATAPNFILNSTPDQKLSLSDFRGRRVILAFYPADWCHAAYARDRKLHFPLLADFEPKGSAARDYGVYAADVGMAGRALFVLDEAGVIQWSYVSPMGVNPGADGILTALERSTTGRRRLRPRQRSPWRLDEPTGEKGHRELAIRRDVVATPARGKDR